MTQKKSREKPVARTLDAAQWQAMKPYLLDAAFRAAAHDDGAATLGMIALYPSLAAGTKDGKSLSETAALNGHGKLAIAIEKALANYTPPQPIVFQKAEREITQFRHRRAARSVVPAPQPPHKQNRRGVKFRIHHHP